MGVGLVCWALGLVYGLGLCGAWLRDQHVLSGSDKVVLGVWLAGATGKSHRSTADTFARKDSKSSTDTGAACLPPVRFLAGFRACLLARLLLWLPVCCLPGTKTSRLARLKTQMCRNCEVPARKIFRLAQMETRRLLQKVRRLPATPEQPSRAASLRHLLATRDVVEATNA